MTYQMTFWVADTRWLVDRPSDKEFIDDPNAVWGSDYLATPTANEPSAPQLWNHQRTGPERSPEGQNILYSDGRTAWTPSDVDQWTLWSDAGGNLHWWLYAPVW